MTSPFTQHSFYVHSFPQGLPAPNRLTSRRGRAIGALHATVQTRSRARTRSRSLLTGQRGDFRSLTEFRLLVTDITNLLLFHPGDGIFLCEEIETLYRGIFSRMLSMRNVSSYPSKWKSLLKQSTAVWLLRRVDLNEYIKKYTHIFNYYTSRHSVVTAVVGRGSGSEENDLWGAKQPV